MGASTRLRQRGTRAPSTGEVEARTVVVVEETVAEEAVSGSGTEGATGDSNAESRIGLAISSGPWLWPGLTLAASLWFTLSLDEWTKKVMGELSR